MLNLLSPHCKVLLPVVLLLIVATAARAQTAVPVAVMSAQTQPVYREVEITGTVTSPQVAQLSTATDGLIIAMHADEGDQVEAGQTLLTLDSELVAQQVASAKAQVSQAEFAVIDARRRLKEAESLGPKGGIAETLIAAIRTEVGEDQAVLSRFRAEAARQQVILDRHILKAPFTGIISRRVAEVGEWVAPGQGVFELVATEALRLDFAVAEDFLPRISTETQIAFRLNALPGQRFQGVVKAIVPVAEPGARTFLLRVVPESPVTGMMPGLSVAATLRNPANGDALVVPEDAILRYPDGRVVVWTVVRNGDQWVAVEKQVTAGASFTGLVAIEEGLEAGDQVVVKGNEALQNSQPVRIVPATGG